MNNVAPLFNPTALSAAMDEARCDLLIATQPSNIQYLTRYRRPTKALGIIRREDLRPHLVVPAVEVDFCLEDWDPSLEIRTYGSFPRFRSNGRPLSPHERFISDIDARRADTSDPWKVVADLLSSWGMESASIGIDTEPSSVSEVLRTTRMQNETALLRSLRSVKSSLEISRLAEAARITELAIEASIGVVERGITQREMARVFSAAVVNADAEVRSNNVSIGYGTILGNANIPDIALEEGNVIRFDVGCFYAGYSSDVARTFSFRSADQKVSHYYRALLKGQDRILEMLRPGVAASAIFKAAVEVVKEEIPHYDRTHVGHGIGVAGAGYDPPLLGPNDHTSLEEGMVLCVETPYFEFGFAGLQVEDMVVLTESGFEFLTHGDRNLKVLN